MKGNTAHGIRCDHDRVPLLNAPAVPELHLLFSLERAGCDRHYMPACSTTGYPECSAEDRVTEDGALGHDQSNRTPNVTGMKTLPQFRPLVRPWIRASVKRSMPRKR